MAIRRPTPEIFKGVLAYADYKNWIVEFADPKSGFIEARTRAKDWGDGFVTREHWEIRIRGQLVAIRLVMQTRHGQAWLVQDMKVSPEYSYFREWQHLRGIRRRLFVPVSSTD